MKLARAASLAVSRRATLFGKPGGICWAETYAADANVKMMRVPAAFIVILNQDIPSALLWAIMLEIALYLAACSPGPRARLAASFGALPLALGMILSALAPYVIYSLLSGTLRGPALLWLTGIVAILSFWYLRLPLKWWTDAGFVLLFGAVVLSRIFSIIYFSPGKVHPSILGDLMWTRTAILAAVWFRGMEGINLSLWPSAREWRVGLRQFAWFLPIGLALGYALQFAKLRPAPENWGKFAIGAVAQMAGIYLHVALREEFLFRGLLLAWCTRWWKSKHLALLVVSLLFGALHLPFRQFPNWRFAILAAVAGWFYGRAFQQGKGVRAAMVTHLLVVFVWKVFLV